MLCWLHFPPRWYTCSKFTKNGMPYRKLLFIGLTNICWVPSMFRAWCLISLLQLLPSLGQPSLCSSSVEDPGEIHGLTIQQITPSWVYGGFIVSGSLGNLATWDQVCKELKETHPKITRTVGGGAPHCLEPAGRCPALLTGCPKLPSAPAQPYSAPSSFRQITGS